MVREMLKNLSHPTSRANEYKIKKSHEISPRADDRYDIIWNERMQISNEFLLRTSSYKNGLIFRSLNFELNKLVR